jgi:hypothetical protein
MIIALTLAAAAVVFSVLSQVLPAGNSPNLLTGRGEYAGLTYNGKEAMKTKPALTGKTLVKVNPQYYRPVEVELLRILPEFKHKETGIFLDGKM